MPSPRHRRLSAAARRLDEMHARAEGFTRRVYVLRDDAPEHERAAVLYEVECARRRGVRPVLVRVLRGGPER